MKTYIITGANGFLGNNIIRALQTENCNIRALVLPGDKLHSLDGLRCTLFEGDVTKKETLGDIFTVEDGSEVVVIHCAAIVTIKSKFNQKVYDVNVNGALNVAEKALSIGARLIYVSSVHAIPERGQTLIGETKEFDPALVVGQYAKTKAETANALLKMYRERGLDVVIVHPSGMLGPHDFGNSHLTQLVLDYCNGRLGACVKGGYDFVDVRDVAAGIISAAERGRAGECYILSNRNAAIREILDTVSEVRGAKKIKLMLPMWLAKATAPLSEAYYALLKQPPLYTRYALYTITTHVTFTHEKAAKELGFSPRSLHETIADTVAWLEEQGRIKPPKR